MAAAGRERENATADIRKCRVIDKVVVEQHLCGARREWMKIVRRQRNIVWDWKTKGDIKKRLNLTRQDMLTTGDGSCRTGEDVVCCHRCCGDEGVYDTEYRAASVPSNDDSCDTERDCNVFVFTETGYQKEYCGLNRTKGRRKAEDTAK